MSIYTHLKSYVEGLVSAGLPIPVAAALLPTQCEIPGSIGIQIRRDDDYFQVKVNEIFLASGSEFWVSYEPLAIITSEFAYGLERITIPFIVGPSLLNQQSSEVPNATLLSNIIAAGPYPFRGGKVSLSIVLYRIQKANHAQSLLRVIEGISNALSLPSSLLLLGRSVETAAIGKVANSVLEGVEALFGLGTNVPLLGHRVDFDSGSYTGFATSSTALLGPVEIDPGSLLVKNGRLYELSGGEQVPFRRADYVLYSVERRETRGEERNLPFYKVLQEAERAAAQQDADSWKRAKAALLTIYQEMLMSPDLTSRDADLLLEKYKSRLVEIHNSALRTSELSLSGVDGHDLGTILALPGSSAKIQAATSILDIS